MNSRIERDWDTADTHMLTSLNLSGAPGPSAPNVEKLVKVTRELPRQSRAPVAQTQALLRLGQVGTLTGKAKTSSERRLQGVALTGRHEVPIHFGREGGSVSPAWVMRSALYLHDLIHDLPARQSLLPFHREES